MNMKNGYSFIAGVVGGALVILAFVGTVVLLGANAPGARLADGTIWIGDAGNAAVARTLSGDLTVGNTGVTAIAGSIITSADIAANVIVSADVDADFMQVDNSQLINDEILALEAAPITLIASVAATAIVVHKVMLYLDDTGADYTESADNLVIEYADGTDIVVIEATGFIDATADAARLIIPRDGAAVVVAGAGTACNTTCDGNCISGFDLAAGAEVPLGCADAGADTCLCYRPSVPVSASAVRITTVGTGEYGGGAVGSTISIRIWYSEVPMAAFNSGG